MKNTINNIHPSQVDNANRPRKEINPELLESYEYFKSRWAK